MEKIILLGIGGHAHSVVDSIEQNGVFQIAGFLDTEKKKGAYFRDYHVLGTDTALEKCYRSGVKCAFITIGFLGDGDTRNKLYRQLKGIGYKIPVIVDRTAVVATDAVVQEGTFVGKNAVVNANVNIGKMCIINTGAIIEHDCRIGDFSHVAAGSVLCGGVIVGEQSLIGANATVIQETKIGSHSVIGAGAAVIADVPDQSTAVGIPARVMEKKK